MFDVIFYFFYRIYNKLPKDVDPETSASLALGACIGLFITKIVNIILFNFLSFDIGVWPKFVFCILISFSIYWHYEIKGNWIEVMNRKPLFFKSKPLSIIIIILFFLITVSTLFW